MSAVRTFKTSAAVSLGALALGALAVTPSTAAAQPETQPASVSSQATTPAGDHHHDHHFALGKVVSRIGVNVRSEPNTHSEILDVIPSGAIVKLKCKVIGENVHGNNRWYKLAHKHHRHHHHHGWVSARWVKNLDHVPWCHFR